MSCLRGNQMKNAAGVIDLILLSRLNSIDGQLKSINTGIDSIDGKIGSVHNEVGALCNEMISARSELLASLSRFGQKVDSLAGRFDLIKDMETLKVKVAELEKRR
jgi:hypothetical protein